jgi:lysophospholipase L1-like esterase
MSPPFAYENLNHRRPALVTSALRRALPGVGRVAAQGPPYAAWWREHNLDALAADGPLWVVLGDSMSQGIGASSARRGWVPLVESALHARSVPLRTVNLSFSGARVADVLERQLAALEDLEARPAVVSVLVGSNDLLRRSLRRELGARYAELLDRLPPRTLVATTPGAGRLAEVADIVDRHPGVIAVPLAFARGELAEDRFHPDDAAYARLARTFTDPVAQAVVRHRA